MKPRQILDLFVKTLVGWSERKAPTYAAAIAYSTLFSLAPLLVLSVHFASLTLNQAEVQARLVETIERQVGSQVARLTEEILAMSFTVFPSRSATLISALFLLWGASGVFLQMRGGLNAMWGIDIQARTVKQTLFHTAKSYIVSVSVALVIGIIPIFFLFSSTLLALLPSDLLVRVSRTGWLPAVIRAFASPVIYFLLFSAILKYLPQAKISWRAIWPGSLLAALLFWIGGVVLGWYLQNSAIQSLYGAAGSAIALLLWAYYSAWILLFGAKFIEVYARARGYPIVPHQGVGYVYRLAPPEGPSNDGIPTLSFAHLLTNSGASRFAARMSAFRESTPSNLVAHDLAVDSRNADILSETGTGSPVPLQQPGKSEPGWQSSDVSGTQRRQDAFPQQPEPHGGRQPMRRAEFHPGGAGGEERGDMFGHLGRRARQRKAAQQVVVDEAAGRVEIVARRGRAQPGQQLRVDLQGGVQLGHHRQVERHLAPGQGPRRGAVLVHHRYGADHDADLCPTPARSRRRLVHQAAEMGRHVGVGAAADLHLADLADAGANRLLAPTAQEKRDVAAEDGPAQRVAACQREDVAGIGRGRAAQQMAHALQRLAQRRDRARGCSPTKSSHAPRASPR